MNPDQLQQLIAANDDYRQAIVATAMPMQQPLQSQTISGTVTSSNNILTFQPRLTGLLLGFIVEINSTITNTGSGTASRTNFGALNAIKRIQFVDLNNQTRINTTGWHLGLLNSMRMGRGYGAATAQNLPYNVGNVNNVNSFASTVASSSGSEALRQFYWVPAAYSQSDLRGSIYMQVVNATSQLQITVNDAAGYTTGDPLSAIAGGANTAVLQTAATVTVTQVYYDQLPRANNVPLLPVVDISTMYQIQDTTMSALVVNQDNTTPYTNFRTYLSTLAVYDNAGVFNLGTDVSYWALQYANLTRQFQLNPETVYLFTRNQVGFDLPPAVAYFDHRNYPIATSNYGNAELVFRPSAVTAGAYLAIGFEWFAQQQSIITASSLPNT